jgi:hypothetical protein
VTPAQLLSGLKITLSSHLGRYVTPAGAVPSIFIGPDLPTGYRMDETFGRNLECIIYPTTEGNVIRENYRTVELEGVYRVVIRDHSPVLSPQADPQGTGAARDAILAAWRTKGNPVTVQHAGDVLEQVTVFIRNV